MTVYVDNMHESRLGQLGRMKMSHMIADTTEELLAMADRIGVQRKWLQYPGSHKEHFDIALSKRALAVAAGAVEIDMEQTSAMCRRRRETGELGLAEEAVEWVRAQARDAIQVRNAQQVTP